MPFRAAGPGVPGSELDWIPVGPGPNLAGSQLEARSHLVLGPNTRNFKDAHRQPMQSLPLRFENGTNPGTGPQTREIGPIGPQRANRGWPGACQKSTRTRKLLRNLGLVGFGGKRAHPNTSWRPYNPFGSRDSPASRFWNHFLSKTMLFGLVAVGSWIPTTAAGAAGQVSEIQGTL